MTFTFKKHKATGRYASFEKEYSDIKLKKKVVGTIHEIEGGKRKVRFMVKKQPTKEEPAPFLWITVTKTFYDEEEARTWCKQNIKLIQEKLDLYQFEE